MKDTAARNFPVDVILLQFAYSLKMLRELLYEKYTAHVCNFSYEKFIVSRDVTVLIYLTGCISKNHPLANSRQKFYF